jgi:ribonuclease BN (tRNA processing enzyme)
VGLTITVLGCGGTYAGPGNACSGYLVRSDRTTVLLDQGPGTLANAQRHVDLASVDAVVLSHEHPDHWLDFPVTRNVFKYVKEREGMPVYGTATTKEMAEHLCSDGIAPTFDWTVIADGHQPTIGDLELSFSRTDHPVETLAVGVRSDGHSLVYSADTGPAWSPTAFGFEPELAVIEATFDQYYGPGLHLTAEEAGERGAAAGARHLVITHLLPGTDAEVQRSAAEAAYGGAVDVAEVNATYTA